jgi:epoxyqueuosine reductase
MQNEIINLLPNPDDYVIGFADMDGLLSGGFAYKYAIVFGAKLNDHIINDIETGPTIYYFEHYHNTNAKLNELAVEISNYLTSRNIESRPVPATLEDKELDEEFIKTLRYKYSHKMAATRSGIGWIGKTDLLVSEKFGPRLRLASVLTNYKFESLGTPVKTSKCGKCTVCVEKCPGQAASGMLWNTSIDRNDFFDAAKCRETCRSQSLKFIHKDISLCGVCVSVCPIGKR